MTVASSPRVRRSRGVLALRAGLIAVFAVAVTLSADGLGKLVLSRPEDAAALAALAFGAFEVLHAVVSALGVRLVPSRTGRLLQAVRAGVLAVFGLLALLLAHAGLGALLLIVTVAFLLSGVLELLVGLRRPDADATSRDSVAMGVLAMLVGIVLSLLPPDVTVTVGVLAAWAAIAAVYLAIAAVSLGGPQGARA